jgi:hypothetical protein
MMTLTIGTVDLVKIRETSQIRDEEEIVEQLDVRRLLVMLELGIFEERRIVSIDIGLVTLSGMLFSGSLRDVNIRLFGLPRSCSPGDSEERGFGGILLRSS